MSKKKMEEIKIESQLLYNGRILKLFKDKVRLDDGREAIKEVVRHNEAICVLPIEKENIILVRQFRYPIQRESIEIPAGLLESGEKPEEAAQRELKEETGYSAKNIRKLFSFYSSPGFTDEKLHLFIAEGLELGAQDMDPDEEIDVVKMSAEELYSKIFNGEIEDSKTIIAGLYLSIIGGRHGRTR